MAKPTEIAHWKAHYSTMSDEEVIAQKHSWVEHAEQHIAAVQILHERQTASQLAALEEARRQHTETLSQNKTLHSKTQRVAWIAVVVSAIAAALAVPPLLSSTKPKDAVQSQAPEKPGPIASPLPSSNSAPQATKARSATQPATPPKP